MTREKFLSKAKTRFSFSNLNTQVFFFVVVPVSLLFLTITFGSIQLHQQAMRDLVGERDLRTVRSTTNAIREQLNHLASAIQQVAVRLDEGSDPTEILDSVSFLMDDFDAGMGIFSADGELYSFILGELPQELVVEKISQMLPAIVDQGDAEPVFAEPFQFEDKGDYFSFVFFWGADQKQVVVGVFSISRLARQTLADITPYDNKRLILLIGQNGEVLYQNGILHLSEDIAQHPG